MRKCTQLCDTIVTAVTIS